VTAYTYDDNGRLLVEELRQNDVLVGSVEYGYDNNGNTKTRTKKDAAGVVVETVTYSWNKENCLVGVTASPTSGKSWQAALTLCPTVTTILPKPWRRWASGGDKRPRTVTGKTFRAIEPPQKFLLIDKIIS
jgi:hypothetical protein